MLLDLLCRSLVTDGLHLTILRVPATQDTDTHRHRHRHTGTGTQAQAHRHTHTGTHTHRHTHTHTHTLCVIQRADRGHCQANVLLCNDKLLARKSWRSLRVGRGQGDSDLREIPEVGPALRNLYVTDLVHPAQLRG